MILSYSNDEGLSKVNIFVTDIDQSNLSDDKSLDVIHKASYDAFGFEPTLKTC